MTSPACPACDTYPDDTQRRIDAAGRAHTAALARLRAGHATERDLPSAPTERLAGGASWWADGAPWDLPAVPA